jgi:mycothiol synthase
LHVLARPLPAPQIEAWLRPPAGVRLRAFDPARDRDGWLALSNAAFAGHPENGGWSREDLDWRLGAEWSDPERFVLAVEAASGALLGGVWTKLEPGGDDGELYVVAVAPSAQGRGVGRLVVAAAVRALEEAGCSRAHLYADAANAPALRLYAAAGFSLDHEDRSLCLRVRPAPGEARIPTAAAHA